MQLNSNDPIWAANLEGNADCEEGYCSPLGADFDPHWGLAIAEKTFSFTFDCHISPICEEHSVVNRGKDHHGLKDHSRDGNGEDAGFLDLNTL